VGLDGVNLKCADCKMCNRRGGLLARATRAAVTGGVSEVNRATQGSFKKTCSLCNHDPSEHKIKDIKAKTTATLFTTKAFGLPGLASTLDEGDFGFEPNDAIGIRGAFCLETASSSAALKTPMVTQKPYSLVFLCDRIEIYEPRGAELLATTPYSAVRALTVGGPGLQVEESTTGGGFIGGGFGLAGIAVGVAASSVLNKLTTKTKRDVSLETLLRIETHHEGIGSTEWIFLTNVGTPQELESLLRPITLHLADLARSAVASETAQTNQSGHEGSSGSNTQDKIARLKELSELRDIGALDEEEFARLKDEILG
jgi:hypothetical protein